MSYIKLRKRLLAVLSFICLLTACSGNGGDNPDNSLTENKKTSDVNTPNINATPFYDISSGYEWGNVKIVGGGYTTGIIYNPTEEGLVYARTDIGGAYRMDRESGKWIPLTDMFGSDDYTYYGIDGLASDPVEPNRVYLLAGMYKGWKSAVLCSDDYGETWEVTPLEFPCGGNEPNRFCDRLVIDPGDNKTLYLGSRTSGLWVSRDYGKSFSKMEFPTLGLGYTEDGYSFGITAIFPDPDSGVKGEPCKTIYIGTGDRMNYVTRDGGITWEELALPKGMLLYHIDKNGKNIYFTMGSKAGPYQVSGGTLRMLDTETGVYADITPENFGKQSGIGDLAIDCNSPGIMYISTIGRWGAHENDVIFRTADYGKTWEPLFENDGENRIFDLDISEAPWLDWGGERAKLGWMMGCLALNPFNSDELMYGTGATIFASENLTAWGTENVLFKVKCDGLEETAVLGLDAPNSDDIRLYSALGDIDGFTHTDVDSVPKALNGNGFYGNSYSISSAWQNPLIAARAGNADKCVSITADGGASWKSVRPEGAVGDKGTVEVNCDGSAVYWTNSGSPYIFASYDLGETWTKLDKVFANANMETDKFNPDIIYAVTGGMLYVSRDKGQSFEASPAIIPEKAVPVSDPSEEGTVWFASSYRGIFKATAYGTENCVKIGMQSASCMAFGIGENEESPYAMYAIGTNEKTYGIWRSVDAGISWQRINDDKHQFGAIGNAIAADMRVFGQVYFGSNGRGIIMGRLAG